MKEPIDTQPPSDQSRTLAALEKLVSKKGITLGNMSSPDMTVTLAMAAMCIPANVALAESAVNQALRRWLDEEGAMLRIDHVELRRTLIDMGYWQRDGFGRTYERRPLPVDHPAHEHVAVLESIEITRFVADARARNDALRAQRMAAHAQKS
ncbi:DUF2087 domain-containing protein [Burkholderia sp. TSV86]|uniref:DUF2087 domain-containing protein n=1 Tax=Burkholderia sp. TSV86 TaxID=1385594 RepID=UPI0009E861CE|nr:DUF2087 domain-containing protein [Burkholderia sp. TSV86]